jgi:hypothetical protein
MTERRAMVIGRRQHELLLRSSELRTQMTRDTAVLQAPLALADQVRTGWAWLRAHPEWPLGAVVVLAVLRPRRALRWGSRLWWAWRSWRRVQRLVDAAARH